MSKANKDSLGDRMKAYEEVNERKLVNGVPFIIRLDGIAFHTFTKNFIRPVDEIMADTMKKTMLALCADIPHCKYGYTQSDEITLVCVVDDIKKSQSIYNGRINKIITATAAKATKFFNKFFYENVMKYKANSSAFKDVTSLSVYEKKLFMAEFDSRVFNIPEYDVINNLIWRQQDAVRNSTNNLGFAYLGKKAVYKKSLDEVNAMLLAKGIDWNACSAYQKHGCCAYKVLTEVNAMNGTTILRNKWKLDLEMPVLALPESRKQLNEILFGSIIR